MFILVHAAHAGCGGRIWGFFFGNIYDEGSHGDGGGGDGDGVLDGFAGDAGGVYDAGFLHVGDSLFWSHDVDAEAWFGGLYLSEEGLGVETGVFKDVGHWGFEGLFDDFRTGVFIGKFGGEIDEGNTTAGDDTFGEGGLSGGYGVVYAELLFVDFGFGGATDFDDGYFAEEGGCALFVLFPFVVGSSGVGLAVDESDTLFDVGASTGAFDDGGFIFGGDDFLGGAEAF